MDISGRHGKFDGAIALRVQGFSAGAGETGRLCDGPHWVLAPEGGDADEDIRNVGMSSRVECTPNAAVRGTSYLRGPVEGPRGDSASAVIDNQGEAGYRPTVWRERRTAARRIPWELSFETFSRAIPLVLLRKRISRGATDTTRDAGIPPCTRFNGRTASVANTI